MRLARLLQPGLRRRDLLSRLKTGQRVPDEGETLLVEYPDSPAARQLAGHAIYTRLTWLPFHAAEVARRFYGWSEAAVSLNQTWGRIRETVPPIPPDYQPP